MRQSQNLKLPLLDPQDLVQRSNINGLAETLDESLLKGSTKALYGLGADAVPDDAFAMLGPYTQYWWRRRAGNWVPQLTSAGNEGAFNVCTGSNESACVGVVQYADELNISGSGEISLKNPQSLTVPWTGGAAVAETLIGKYVLGMASYPNDIVFVGDDVEAENNSSSTLYWVRLEPKASCYLVAASFQPTGDWQYVQSSDRNAYPDGITDIWEYTFLGRPLDNAVSPAKIETGAYVGTGTFGADAKTKLEFDASPKMIFVMPQNDTESYGCYQLMAIRGVTRPQTWFYNRETALGAYVRMSWGEKTVEWYSSVEEGNAGADIQLNTAGVTYLWVALF